MSSEYINKLKALLKLNQEANAAAQKQLEQLELPTVLRSDEQTTRSQDSHFTLVESSRVKIHHVDYPGLGSAPKRGRSKSRSLWAAIIAYLKPTRKTNGRRRTLNE